jgi:hypothetical protein
MSGMAGLIVFFAVQKYIGTGRSKGHAVVAGRSCDPTLHERGDIDSKILSGG